MRRPGSMFLRHKSLTRRQGRRWYIVENRRVAVGRTGQRPALSRVIADGAAVLQPPAPSFLETTHERVAKQLNICEASHTELRCREMRARPNGAARHG